MAGNGEKQLVMAESGLKLLEKTKHEGGTKNSQKLPISNLKYDPIILWSPDILTDYEI